MQLFVAWAIVAQRSEVHRLFGRCLIRLQQYERLLKEMIAAQQFSGVPETFVEAFEARKAEARSKTLGTLVGRLMSEYVTKEGEDLTADMSEVHEGLPHFGLRIQLNLPAESYNSTKDDLRELVNLRNALVHHFIERHDLGTVAGCLHAQEEINRAYAVVDQQFEQLSRFAVHMDESKKTIAELVNSPEFREMLVNGILPDGQVHWPSAGIVRALRQAFLELSIDGWVDVAAAALWVAEHEPEQTPQKYGCSRWRHVVHESGQFELRRLTRNGKPGVWFKERSRAAD
jgi:hypothetical protein